MQPRIAYTTSLKKSLSLREKLEQLAHQLATGRCPRGLRLRNHHRSCIRDEQEQLSQDDFALICEIIASGQLRNGFVFDLSEICIGGNGMRALASVLEFAPKDFTLNLSNSDLGNYEAILLFSAFKQIKCQKGLTLILDHNNKIGLRGAQAIVDALPFCPEQFKLSMTDAKYFHSNEYKPRFTYQSTPKNYQFDSVYKCFIDPIVSQQSKFWPRGLQLHVDQFLPLMQAITLGIKNGSLPKDFGLKINDFNPSQISVNTDKALIQSLSSPHCPLGIRINHHFPPYKMPRTFFKAKSFPITELIENGHYAEGMHLDLSHELGWIPRHSPLFPTISELHANKILAKAIRANKGPRWSLTMDFSLYDYSDNQTYLVPGWQDIIDAIKHNTTLSALKINGINAAMAEALLDALKVNQSLTQLSLTCDTSVTPQLIDEIEGLISKNRIHHELSQFISPEAADVVLAYKQS